MSLTFKSYPSDAELARLEPDYFCGPQMKLVERAHELRAGPTHFPLWLPVGCLAFDLIGFGTFFLYILFAHQSTGLGASLAFFSTVTAVAFLALTVHSNRKARESGDFFLLDKEARTLDLPREREKAVLSYDKIIRLMLFEAPDMDNYIYDLAAVTQNPDGTFTRYTVFRDAYADAPIHAKKIAAALQISLEHIKVNALLKHESFAPV